MTSASLLSEFEAKYPFSPTSRSIFERIPFEESLRSKEVIEHTEQRLLASLGRDVYERHLSPLIEFVSFFASAFIASQDSFLASKFANREAAMARSYFLKESSETKIRLMDICFGIKLSAGGRYYVLPFEHYLERTCRFNIIRLQKWKLGRQDLISGLVYLNENKLSDLFTDCTKSLISEGVANLKRGVFPRQLEELRKKVLSFIPKKKLPSSGKYSYIEELLRHPVYDGRHRLVWLVLAPYLVNIKGVDDSQAIDIIRNYVSVAGESGDMKRFIEYNVRRARKNGLMPPTLTTLRNEHPDLFALLPPEVKTKNPKNPLVSD